MVAPRAARAHARKRVDISAAPRRPGEHDLSEHVLRRVRGGRHAVRRSSARFLCLSRETVQPIRDAMLLAFAAFALGMSKIQHLLLPMMCAVTVLIFDYVKTHRSSWRASALFVGAIAALLVQVAQLHRDNAAIRDIDMFNHADVAFTGLLPNASDPLKNCRCARPRSHLHPVHAGTARMAAAGLPARDVCPTIANVSRGRELNALLHDPMMARAIYSENGVLALDPWVAPGLGTVEGGHFDPPAAVPSSRQATCSPPRRCCAQYCWRGRSSRCSFCCSWRRHPSGMRRYTVPTVAQSWSRRWALRYWATVWPTYLNRAISSSTRHSRGGFIY